MNKNIRIAVAAVLMGVAGSVSAADSSNLGGATLARLGAAEGAVSSQGMEGLRSNSGVRFGEAVRGGDAPAVYMDGDFSPAATVAVTAKEKKAPAVSVPAPTPASTARLEKGPGGKFNWDAVRPYVLATVWAGACFLFGCVLCGFTPAGFVVGALAAGLGFATMLSWAR